MSDVVWQAIIAGVVTIVLSYLSYRFGGKLNKIERTGAMTHALVNANMGLQLRLVAVSARRLAMLTKAPEDVEAADMAELLLKEHQVRQAVADAQAKQVLP